MAEGRSGGDKDGSARLDRWERLMAEAWLRDGGGRDGKGGWRLLGLGLDKPPHKKLAIRLLEVELMIKRFLLNWTDWALNHDS
ncbi:hypothetical protein V6N12_047567 [Hibiscus sabdariffa]|uniref:Uncharacterized protein n=1 Tax=Hibiscus sabdariffa TaxID=183260 RepID=A0ABR2DB91_9ROSI